MGASPQAVDWDEDGDIDLLSGEYSGYVTLFKNIGTGKTPVLTNAGHIKAGGADIDVGNLSVPVVCDFNADGKKDLIIGCDAGYVYYYQNVGTNAAPAFNTYVQLKANGAAIVQMKNFPEIADMNEDGLNDLVMGWYMGSCLYWPNYGTNANPVFYESYELTGFTDPIDPDPVNPNWSHMEVCDWNEDGHPDILYTRWESELFIHLNAADLLQIQVEPVNPPIVIPPEGGPFSCRVTVSNSSVYDAILDGWNEAVLPNGTLYGPVIMREDMTLEAGKSQTFVIRHRVPAGAPAGTYQYGAYLGMKDNGYFESDYFKFQKK